MTQGLELHSWSRPVSAGVVWVAGAGEETSGDSGVTSGRAGRPPPAVWWPTGLGSTLVPVGDHLGLPGDMVLLGVGDHAD